MATIGHFNDIFVHRGAAAAVRFAEVSAEPKLRFAAELARKGEWDPKGPPKAAAKRPLTQIEKAARAAAIRAEEARKAAEAAKKEAAEKAAAEAAAHAAAEFEAARERIRARNVAKLEADERAKRAHQPQKKGKGRRKAA